MKMKSRISVTGNYNVAGILIGVICALGISLLLVAAVTGLMLNGKIGEENSSAFVFVIVFLSVMIGVLLSVHLIREKVLLTGCFITLGYLLVLLILCVVFYDSGFRNVPLTAVTAITGGGTGCAIRLYLQNKPRKRLKSRK